MLKRSLERNGEKVVFSLEIDQQVSVVGDFNEWDPNVNPLVKRAKGKRSVALVLPAGRYSFRYLAEDGAFFDDSDADEFEPNGFGETHSVLMVAGATLAASDGQKVKTPKSSVKQADGPEDTRDAKVNRILKRGAKLPA